MKKVCFLIAVVCLSYFAIAQDTPDQKDQQVTTDTVRLGNVIIIRPKNKQEGDTARNRYIRRKKKPKNLKTTWFIPDIGLTNYTDRTAYSSSSAQQFAPGADKDWFKLRPAKSVNVNIWIFMQRLNMVKHVLNLKYGLGLELNNYRYNEAIRFQKSPTLVYMDDIVYRKNKLAADYITAPLMLNFNFTPKAYDCKSFGLSLGVSAGYLYSSRQKYINNEAGKNKFRDDFDLRPFKISYVAELKLGPIGLYGSVAARSMFEKGLDQTPYTMGLRFSYY